MEAELQGRRDQQRPGMQACLALLVFFLSGCTHPLEVRNLSSYEAPVFTFFEKPVTIGITGRTKGMDEDRLLKVVVHTLRASSVKVVMPYAESPERPVDLVVDIDIKSDYAGSGMNFLRNFPGFLVFAPAWNGYAYEVKHTVNVRLSEPGLDPFAQFSLPVKLRLRHADINRTWVLGGGYLTCGIIPLITGFEYVSYDENLTPLVTDVVEGPLGRYIAAAIVNRIKANGLFTRRMEAPGPYRLACPPEAVPVPHG